MCRWFPCAVAAFIGLSSASFADEFTKHAVAAQEKHAVLVGRDILRKGGSAVDAAVATAFALAVTHPAAGNLGGGGFLVAFDAATQQVTTFEFRETAPASATERMYLDDQGKLRPGHQIGPAAAGVPGTVRGLELTHRTHGKLPWTDVVTPAVRLARDGFPISRMLARSLNAQLRTGAPRPDDDEDAVTLDNRLAQFESSVNVFSKADRSAWSEGDVLVQRDLAATLERIEAQGSEGFYRGTTADLITDYCRVHGGYITKEDLASYVANQRAPTHVTYRDHDVYSVGPPSSGGVVVGLILNMVEPMDLRTAGADSPRTIHRIAEAMRRAFFVRATQLGDPAFTAINTDELLSKPYAERLASSIDALHATPSASLASFPIEARESAQTTHLSVIDALGNAVALTYTLEEAYGCKAVVEGAGFLLSNEMGDFNVVPGRTDDAGLIGTVANRIAPGKRMLSSQSPTIVTRDGRVRLVTGSPGGRTIPNTTAWVVLQVVEFDQPLESAVAAARIHQAWMPDKLSLEGREWPAQTLDTLRRLGHSVVTGGTQGNANSIAIDPKTGRISAVADARDTGSHAAGD